MPMWPAELTAQRTDGAREWLICALALFVFLGACRSDPNVETLGDWLRHLNNLENVDQEVLARIEASGGTPIVSGEKTLFLAQSNGNDEPRIIGDFNQGGSTSSEFVGNGTMHQIANSSWYGLEARLPSDAYIGYQVQHGRAAAADPLNPKSVRTFGAVRSVVEGRLARRSLRSTASIPQGSFDQFVVASRFRGNERRVSVYLPLGYRSEGPRLPTIYVKDGTRFRSEGELPAILDAAIADGYIAPVILVFVDPVNRGLEYGTATAYRRFIAEELVPEVERRYATGGAPERRALLGASRGGLAVIDLGVQHSELFGFTAAMSPALRPLPIIDAIEERSQVEGHFLVMVSRFDSPELVDDGEQLIHVLEGRADRVIPVFMPIDHSIHGWKRWLDVVLIEWGKYMHAGDEAQARSSRKGAKGMEVVPGRLRDAS